MYLPGGPFVVLPGQQIGLKHVAGAGVELDIDGLTLAFSKFRLRGDRRRRYGADRDPRTLRIEIVGTLKYGKLVERRARRRRPAR